MFAILHEESQDIFMKITARHILIAWVSTVAAFVILLQVFPHLDVSASLFMIITTQTLGFFVSLAVARRETNPKNKAIFYNFTALFSIGFFGMIGPFVTPASFPTLEYLYAYYDTFIAHGLYGLLLTFSIAYLTIDVLFRDFKLVAKYAVTFVVVGGFFYGYFHNFIGDPLYCYHSQDVYNWKSLNSADSVFQANNQRQATPEELAKRTDLYVYQDGQEVAVLNDEARLSRIHYLMPYLSGWNYLTLIAKPIKLYLMQMSIASIGFILLFFGYLYMKDPPQGAYIEKIMFLLLIYCSMEVLHAYSSIKSVEWSTLAGIMETGQYASNFTLALIMVYLALRLRFISSVRGEFYETELSERPAAITRWRDTLDNMVVESFFNRHTLMGRLFAVPEHQRHQH
jgi:hypothetical protein